MKDFHKLQLKSYQNSEPTNDTITMNSRNIKTQNNSRANFFNGLVTKEAEQSYQLQLEMDIKGIKQ